MASISTMYKFCSWRIPAVMKTTKAKVIWYYPHAIAAISRMSMWPQLWFWLEIANHKNPLPWARKPLSNSNIILLGRHTSVPTKWHLVQFNGFRRGQECDRQTDGQTDRQTALHTVTSGAIAGITLAYSCLHWYQLLIALGIVTAEQL